MSELVPQRRFPQEIAGRLARVRRVERHHAAEARAERADHPGQSERAHGEVVVLGKHLDQNRALRLELILRRHRLQRLVRESDDVFLQDRRFVLVQPHDEIAVADGLELVERIEQAEQVEGDDVVRVDRERGVEGRARGGLVAGAQQLRAEVGERTRIARRQNQRPPCHQDGFVEPVVMGEQFAGRAIDVGVVRRHRLHLRDFGFELRVVVFDKRERRERRVRVDARRIHRERFLNQIARLAAVIDVRRLAGEKELRVRRLRIDLQHALDHRCRLRRIVIRERARGAEQRGRPARIRFEGGLIRLDRFGVVVLLEEQVAPGRLNVGVHRRGGCGDTERVVGGLEAIERLQRASAARHLHGAARRRGEFGDALERLVGRGPAEHLLQQAELERGFARLRAQRDGLQQRFRIRVASALDARARLQRHDVGIARVELVGQSIDFVVPAFDEGARCGFKRRRRLWRRRRTGRLPLRLGKDKDRAQRHGDRRDERGNTHGARRRKFHHPGSYYIYRLLAARARSSMTIRRNMRAPKASVPNGPAMRAPLIRATPASSPMTAT